MKKIKNTEKIKKIKEIKAVIHITLYLVKYKLTLFLLSDLTANQIIIL
jgi:hypothetical protein